MGAFGAAMEEFVGVREFVDVGGSDTVKDFGDLNNVENRLI